MLMLGGVNAWVAAGAPPTHEPFGPAHVVFPDFFSGPQSPHCAFPVVGEWDASGSITTFFNKDGNVVRVRLHIPFVGTLSNPLTGKSVPDVGHMQITDYYASDGSFIKETEEGVRTGFFKAAFHTVTDSQFNIVKDVGRDWLIISKHPISIEPVCEALG